MKKHIRKLTAGILAFTLLTVSGAPCFALDAQKPSLDTEYYRALKVEFDQAVIDDDVDKQAELISAANNLLDSYMEATPSATAVRADMYSTFFSSSVWLNRDSGRYLSVTPIFGYQWQEVSSYEDSWNALYGRHSMDSYWANTTSMKKQYLCHVNFAGGWKVPWNLEPSKTNVNPFTCN